MCDFFILYKTCFNATLEKLLAVKKAINLYDLRYYTTPACLVTGPQTGTIVTMKVLIKKYQITPVPIGLEFFSTPINRTFTVFIAGKNADNPVA